MSGQSEDRSAAVCVRPIRGQERGRLCPANQRTGAQPSVSGQSEDRSAAVCVRPIRGQERGRLCPANQRTGALPSVSGQSEDRSAAQSEDRSAAVCDQPIRGQESCRLCLANQRTGAQPNQRTERCRLCPANQRTGAQPNQRTGAQPSVFITHNKLYLCKTEALVCLVVNVPMVTSPRISLSTHTTAPAAIFTLKHTQHQLHTENMRNTDSETRLNNSLNHILMSSCVQL